MNARLEKDIDTVFTIAVDRSCNVPSAKEIADEMATLVEFVNKHTNCDHRQYVKLENVPEGPCRDVALAYNRIFKLSAFAQMMDYFQGWAGRHFNLPPKSLVRLNLFDFVERDDPMAAKLPPVVLDGGNTIH